MKYCICQTRATSNKPSNNAMYFASVIPTATVPRFCESQLIAPPSPAQRSLVPIVYCPHISVARVCVRTYVHPAMPVPALGDAGSSCSYYHYECCKFFTMALQFFLTRFQQNVTIVRVVLKISSVVMVGPYMTTLTARGMGFLVFFTPPLLSCSRPLLALSVYRRWYHGGCIHAAPIGGSSFASPCTRSSSQTAQRLPAIVFAGDDRRLP